ncbi:MAG: ATP-binding cassette domain-containing protein, partial [Acidobacteriota bacterium]
MTGAENVTADPGLRNYTIDTVTDTPMLELNDATVVKDHHRVLDRVSLTIAEGEHTAIVGPNGAGKSILVNLLTHQERALARTNGTPPVRVFGADRWHVFDLRSQLGIVSTDLHYRLVTGNNEGSITGEAAVLSAFLVSHGILRYGVVTDEMRDRAAAALEIAGVAHLAARTLDEMSTGEARRVLLARALVTSPRVLFLDEPTTGLDLAGQHDFLERIRAIARAGTTILLITHHIEEIIPEIGRVILLGAGRVVADGPKRSILTGERLSHLFGLPLHVGEADGHHYARPTGRRGAGA